MSRQWESTFSTWSQSPSKTENERIDRTINSIKNALNANELLSINSKIYVQGSYRNRVNVKQDSDVDIGIIYTGNTFYPDYPEGMTATDFGNIDGDYNYKDFKNEVEKALVAYFGKSAMPTRILDVHLHRQVLKNDQYRPKKSDLEDWGGIGVASCYCDVVVCEKHFANMLSRNNYKPTARVVTRLDDVIECTV